MSVACFGSIDLSRSPWFSLEIMEEDWPWIFEKDRKAALVISTLEALAVLVALKLQFGEIPGGGRTNVTVASTLTGERCSSEQTYDDEVSRVRSAHGTVLQHEEDEHSDGCSLNAPRGEQRSGPVCKRSAR